MRPAEIASGTKPPGTSDEVQASLWVERMFARIAPRYDLLNHLLSFNIDRAWRSTLIESLAPVLEGPEAKILDLCCGTGDVLLELEQMKRARIFGADFCHPMLTAAQHKAERKGIRARLFEADALKLPLADSVFDAIVISFGFRNLANYTAGLAELQRVIKPGGQLAILEFSQPEGAVMKAAYAGYSRMFLPLVGALISGSREAYDYLPSSIRKFPSANQLREMMSSAGFVQTEFRLLTGGIAALHLGIKASASHVHRAG